MEGYLYIQVDLTLEANLEAYSELCQTCKMEVFAKIIYFSF